MEEKTTYLELQPVISLDAFDYVLRPGDIVEVEYENAKKQTEISFAQYRERLKPDVVLLAWLVKIHTAIKPKESNSFVLSDQTFHTTLSNVRPLSEKSKRNTHFVIGPKIFRSRTGTFE